MTRDAAEKLFEIPPGVRVGDCDALRYMAITVKAKTVTQEKMPAVCSCDGTARIQIVSEKHDPVMCSVLRAFKKVSGEEVLLNTSLNICTPIALTIKQALETVRRAEDKLSLFIVSDEGDAFLAGERKGSLVARYRTIEVCFAGLDLTIGPLLESVGFVLVIRAGSFHQTRVSCQSWLDDEHLRRPGLRIFLEFRFLFQPRMKTQPIQV